MATVAVVATISELYHYPVKGCAGVGVPAGVLGPAGLEHDRRFLVTDPDGTFRSQRRDPLLATIRPAVDGDQLTLSAPGVTTVHVPIDTTAPRRPVTLFGDPFTGIDQGEDVAAWLSAVLGTPCRLVLAPPSTTGSPTAAPRARPGTPTAARSTSCPRRRCTS
jgi:uncharacterized protein YcbX